MRIHLVSDVHNEFGVLKYTPPECDVVICAGDIQPGVAGVMWAAKTYDVPIVYVAGNHEFYGKRRLFRHYEKMEAKAAELGVHFLQNSVVVIDGVRFVGCTLWTDFNLNGNQPMAMLMAQQAMNDYRQIWMDIKRPIIAQNILEEYQKSFMFLQEELSKDFDGPTVVVTHHGPSELSCLPRYRGNHLNSAYASRLDKFVEVMQPALWVHGHVHDAKEYTIGETRVVVNPRGYVGQEMTGFNPKLVLKV